MTRGLLFGYDDGGHDDARDEEEGGAPSESVDRGIIPIEQRSIQSSPDPYDWSALRTRTRGGASLSQALPCHAPAAPYCASDTPGRGQLEQTLAHNNEPVSHFQNLGDRSGFLITHEVRPIDSGQARYQAPLAGKIKKTSSS